MTMRILGLLLLTVAMQAFAQDTARSVIQKRLVEMDATGKFTVSPAPVKGFHQVIQNGANVFYMSDDGRFIFQGSLIDLYAGKDLTEEAMVKLRVASFKGMSDRFISFGKPDAPYQATVFTDINCGYCRHFHAQMTEINKLGIRINYILAPFQGEEAYNSAVAVWCSANRQDALTRAKLGQRIKAKKCSNPIEDNLRDTQKLKVRGTPAVYLADGRYAGGYMKPHQLLEKFRQSQKR